MESKPAITECAQNASVANMENGAETKCDIYRKLHDELATELEALLRQDDEGGSSTPQHAKQIASLSSALRSVEELKSLEEKGVIHIDAAAQQDKGESGKERNHG